MAGQAFSVYRLRSADHWCAEVDPDTDSNFNDKRIELDSSGSNNSSLSHHAGSYSTINDITDAQLLIALSCVSDGRDMACCSCVSRQWHRTVKHVSDGWWRGVLRHVLRRDRLPLTLHMWPCQCITSSLRCDLLPGMLLRFRVLKLASNRCSIGGMLSLRTIHSCSHVFSFASASRLSIHHPPPPPSSPSMTLHPLPSTPSTFLSPPFPLSPLPHPSALQDILHHSRE